MFQALNEGVVNQDFVEGYTIFKASNVEIFQWSFCDEQLRQINQIPSIKCQSKDILMLSYSTISNPHVGVWCHAIFFFTWLQQMELLEVLMSLQVMLNLKKVVVKR